MSKNQLLLLSRSDIKYVKKWTHGGSSALKKRKTKRPLVPGKVTHAIFKSSIARGKLSLLAHEAFISALIKQLSRKYFVRVQQYVNVGNHIHIKAKFKDVVHFQNFLRVFAALTARRILGAKKSKKIGKFWDNLVFTRVLTSSFEELGLRGYFKANALEAFFGKEAREQYLLEWRGYLRNLKVKRANEDSG